MAIHDSTASMLEESLTEMLLVAKYCIEFRKKSPPWPVIGCYGYPAALILLSVVDSIGSYIKKGNVENHFKILNDINYYNLNLDPNSVTAIYKSYRNTLSHNAVLTPNVILDIGKSGEDVIQKNNNRYLLRLVPFYEITDIVVKKFLKDKSILINNDTIKDITKK